MLLSMPLAEIPHFMHNDDWFASFAKFLEPLGLWPLCVSLPQNGTSTRLRGYYILSGKSPLGDWDHSVVARGDAIVHDPHPDRTRLVTRADAILLVPVQCFGRSFERLA